MALSSLGDRAQSHVLRNQSTALKAELDRRSSEVTTGQSADIARRLRGDFTPLAGLDTTLAQLDAFRSNTSEATLTASAMQSALASLASGAGALSTSLLAAASPGNPTAIDAVGHDASVRFSSAVGVLNTRIGDRTVFAGTETQGPAIAPAEDILAALDSVVAGSVSASQAEAAIAAWFDDPAGFASQGYRGGAVPDPVQIATGESVSLDATASDPAIRDTLKSLAMAALLDRGLLASDPTQRALLARRAGEGLLEGAAGRSGLAARIGSAEERIGSAETRNSAQSTALGIARSGVVSVDPYAAATALTAAETQLDMLYSVTARLSRLHLSNYL